MVSSTFHALPRDRRMFVLDEPTYGTLVQNASTDAVRILSGGIESHVIERTEIDDNRATRSLEDQITGSIPPVPWSIETYLVPSGTAGTPPDTDQLFRKAMGVVTNVPATSDTYSLSDVQGDLGQLSMWEAMGRVGAAGALGYVVSEALSGAWVETMTLKGSAGDPPTVSFSGMGSKYILTGRGTLTSSPSGVDNFTTGDASNLKVGSLFGIYAAADGVTVVDDNSGAGHVVTAIAGTTITASASTITAASGDIFAPLALVPTLVSTPPLAGIIGSLKLATLTIPITSWEVTLTNGLIAHSDEAFQQNTTGYHEDKRRVTGSVSLRLSADQAILLSQRTDLGTQVLEIIIGSVAGNICTINVPKAEYEFAPIEKGGDVALINLPFKALGTGNELNIVFT